MERSKLGWSITLNGGVDCELHARKCQDKILLGFKDRSYSVCWEILYLAEDGLA